MKKTLAMLLTLIMVLALVGQAGTAFAEEADPMAELVAAAQAEGELVVYGSCEEDYLAAACNNFEKMYGIKTSYQRLSTGEVPAKIEEENGKPSADVWFGGTNNPYDTAAAKGLLDNSYVPVNASHLTKDIYKDPNGYWYGIYTGLLGFMVNSDELTRLGLEAPQTWDDLLKPEYQGLIWLSNYNTAGTPKLVANLMIQLKGHDEGIQYLKDLDKNVQIYTKSGSGPSKNVGTGECVIGIGFLHDGITQIVDNGYENVALVVPADGTPSSRAARIPMLPNCLWNMRCLPTAWSWLPRTARISSWSSTMPSSPKRPSSSVWTRVWSGTAMTLPRPQRTPSRT